MVVPESKHVEEAEQFVAKLMRDSSPMYQLRVYINYIKPELTRAVSELLAQKEHDNGVA